MRVTMPDSIQGRIRFYRGHTKNIYLYIYNIADVHSYFICFACVLRCVVSSVATLSATSATQKPHPQQRLMNLHKIYLYLKEKMYESGLNDITLSYLCYFRCRHRPIACFTYILKGGRYSGLICSELFFYYLKF